jgi:hypothetical protein
MAMWYRRPWQINKIATAMPHAMYHRVPCSQKLAAVPTTKICQNIAPIGRV